MTGRGWRTEHHQARGAGQPERGVVEETGAHLDWQSCSMPRHIGGLDVRPRRYGHRERHRGHESAASRPCRQRGRGTPCSAQSTAASYPGAPAARRSASVRILIVGHGPTPLAVTSTSSPEMIRWCRAMSMLPPLSKANGGWSLGRLTLPGQQRGHSRPTPSLRRSGSPDQ